MTLKAISANGGGFTHVCKRLQRGRGGRSERAALMHRIAPRARTAMRAFRSVRLVSGFVPSAVPPSVLGLRVCPHRRWRACSRQPCAPSGVPSAVPPPAPSRTAEATTPRHATPPPPRSARPPPRPRPAPPSLRSAGASPNGAFGIARIQLIVIIVKLS